MELSSGSERVPLAISMIRIDPHPLLDLRALVARFSAPLGELASPDCLRALLDAGAPAPLAPDEELRTAVRALLRLGGYKPTGRGKPSCEYLVRAAAEGTLATIDLAVDACNVASLHGGLPISVVDLDRVEQPLRVGLAPAGSSYVFNTSGQTIDLEGLLCLFDASGPCANAVKDSQRTKTSAGTRATLSLVWGTNAFPERTSALAAWYREMLERAGARCEELRIAPGLPAG